MISPTQTAELDCYLRVMAHVFGGDTTHPESITWDTVPDIMPARLRDACGDFADGDIGDVCADSDRNRRTYYSFCLALIEQILKQDGWRLSRIDNTRIEPGTFGLSSAKGMDRSQPDTAVAVFGPPGGRQRLFFFFSDQDPTILADAAIKINENDNDRFEDLAVMITLSTRDMQARREASRSTAWKRGLFMAFDQLCERSAETYPDLCLPIENMFRDSVLSKPAPVEPARDKIASFRARILDHIVVGDKDSPYRKLRFEAPELAGIVPLQFIMSATRPRASAGGVREFSWQAFKTSFRDAPATYLKRPFGIHRAFHKGFPADYLTRLRLPRHVATILHPVRPDTFEVFFKVLPTGKGTREMQDLKKDMMIDMIGPLGQPFKLAKLIDQDIGEVHVIGGGVGMAPLVYLVQALRFCSVPVKAFIGIESLDHLRYRLRHEQHDLEDEPLARIHAAEGKDIHIYVDDLLQTGVERNNIYVSYDKTGDIRDIVPPANHMQGPISDLYRRSLTRHPFDKPVVAFTCGPPPMMQAIHEITRHVGIRLYVLMEKRMACGIGVCLSCVCRTTSGRSGYSRVCKEGPVFDANEIIWHEQENSPL